VKIFPIFQKGLFGVSVTVFTIIACLAGIQPAEAQRDDISLGALHLHGEMLPEVKLDNTETTLSHTQTGVSLSILTLNLDYTMDYYSWDKLGNLPFGNGKDDPWETLHSLSLGGMYGGEINEKWSWVVIAAGSTAFEKEISSSYLNSTLGGGAIYSLSDRWNLIGGAGAMYTNAPELDFGDLLDDPPEVIPVPVLGVQWNQDAESGLSLSLIFPLEASISYRTFDGALSTSADFLAQSADITYQFTPMFGVTLSGSLDNGTIHQLADDNVAIPVGTKEGYLKTEGRIVDLMLNVKLSEHTNFKAGPYYIFNQEISVRDKEDKALQKVEADDTFGGKFGLSFVF
jgi:hypothetical protein